MTARYKKSKRPISRRIPSATSSPASAGGPSPSASRVGPTTAPSGPGAAPASPSVLRGLAVRSATRGIFGLFGFASSPSGRLQSSLESRLKRQLAGAGSTLFVLTWKRRATPLGRPYSQLAASARRTSGIDFGSWPTPMAGTPLQNGYNEAGSTDSSRKIVELTAWPSPCTPNGGRSMSIEKMDATGRTVDGKKHTASLEHAVKFASWPTPAATDDKSAGGASFAATKGKKGLRLNDHMANRGPILSGLNAQMGKPGQLSPEFSRWLMGYPAEHLSCAPTETRSSLKSQRSS